MCVSLRVPPTIKESEVRLYVGTSARVCTRMCVCVFVHHTLYRNLRTSCGSSCVCVCVPTCKCALVYTYTHYVCARMCVCVSVCACVRMCIGVCVYTCECDISLHVWYDSHTWHTHTWHTHTWQTHTWHICMTHPNGMTHRYDETHIPTTLVHTLQHTATHCNTL